MNQQEVYEYIIKYITNVIPTYEKFKKIPRQNQADFKQDLFTQLATSYKKYNHKRGTFNAFAYGEIRNLIFKAAKKRGDMIDKRESPYVPFYYIDVSPLMIEDMMDFIGRYSSTTHRNVFYMKYVQELPLAKIAKESDISYKKLSIYLNDIKELIESQYA